MADHFRAAVAPEDLFAAAASSQGLAPMSSHSQRRSSQSQSSSHTSPALLQPAALPQSTPPPPFLDIVPPPQSSPWTAPPLPIFPSQPQYYDPSTSNLFEAAAFGSQVSQIQHQHQHQHQLLSDPVYATSNFTSQNTIPADQLPLLSDRMKPPYSSMLSPADEEVIESESDDGSGTWGSHSQQPFKRKRRMKELSGFVAAAPINNMSPVANSNFPKKIKSAQVRPYVSLSGL